MAAKPFNPHPKWREHFPYTELYAHLASEYHSDEVLAHQQVLDFKPDPIIEKFTQHAILPTVPNTRM